MLQNTRSEELVRLVLCGDVMTGRGIDQILLHPSDPQLFEAYMTSARDYVALAERNSGSIPRQVNNNYIWGDAVEELYRAGPDAFVVNLETTITKSAHPAPKGINYRMNPANIGCLTAAHIDVCVLANNHILDWGRDGLIDTLKVLDSCGLNRVGAGMNIVEADAPAIVDLDGEKRLLVFAIGVPTSGIPATWAAGRDKPGISFLPDLSQKSIQHTIDRMENFRRPDDIIIVSIHWGANWGYDISADEQKFAHALIDEAGIHLVHGHSSHHPRSIEIYRGQPILYGCGDFLNDYEGIAGYESYRADLVLLYEAALDKKTGRLHSLELTPFKVECFRLCHPSKEDAGWLRARLRREYGRLNLNLTATENGRFKLLWDK